jgi:hypothetical protein
MYHSYIFPVRNSTAARKNPIKTEIRAKKEEEVVTSS